MSEKLIEKALKRLSYENYKMIYLIRENENPLTNEDIQLINNFLTENNQIDLLLNKLATAEK